jgi:hypothetical protein
LLMDKHKTTKYFGWIFNSLLSLVFIHHPLKFRCSKSIVSYHFTVLLILYCSKSPMSTFWFESFFYLLAPVLLVRFKWFKRMNEFDSIHCLWRTNRFDLFWSHFFSLELRFNSNLLWIESIYIWVSMIDS